MRDKDPPSGSGEVSSQRGRKDRAFLNRIPLKLYKLSSTLQASAGHHCFVGVRALGTSASVTILAAAIAMINKLSFDSGAGVS